MFQELNKPTDKYDHLRIELWYRDKEPRKGYYIHLQKVKYKNGVFSYLLSLLDRLSSPTLITVR